MPRAGDVGAAAHRLDDGGGVASRALDPQASVASDRCASQASKGPAVAPRAGALREHRGQRRLVAGGDDPSRRSEWPASDFVPAGHEKSAPSASGRWPSAVASVLSTATSAPAAWAASATTAMSQTSSSGLDGVSTNTIAAPATASVIADVLVGTAATSTPGSSSARMPP